MDDEQQKTRIAGAVVQEQIRRMLEQEEKEAQWEYMSKIEQSLSFVSDDAREQIISSMKDMMLRTVVAMKISIVAKLN